jgi:hypothetical protein
MEVTEDQIYPSVEFWNQFILLSDADRSIMLRQEVDRIILDFKGEKRSEVFYNLLKGLFSIFGYTDRSFNKKRKKDCSSVTDSGSGFFELSKYNYKKIGKTKVYHSRFSYSDRFGKRSAIVALTQTSGGSTTDKFTYHLVEGRLHVPGALYIATEGESYISKKAIFNRQIDALNNQVLPEKPPNVTWSTSWGEFMDFICSLLQEEQNALGVPGDIAKEAM